MFLRIHFSNPTEITDFQAQEGQCYEGLRSTKYVYSDEFLGNYLLLGGKNIEKLNKHW